MKQFLISAVTTIAMVVAGLYVYDYLQKRKAAKQLAAAAAAEAAK